MVVLGITGFLVGILLPADISVLKPCSNPPPLFELTAKCSRRYLGGGGNPSIQKVRPSFTRLLCRG